MDRQVLIPVTLDPASLHIPGPDEQLVKLGGATMGTGWSAKFYSKRPETDEVARGLEEVFQSVISDFSNWESSSFICRFNEAERGSQHSLNKHISRVLDLATMLVDKSAGAFNPCLGTQASKLLFESPIDDGNDWYGSSNPFLIKETYFPENQLLWQPGNLQLDLSAIAKGYAVDLMAEFLETLHIGSFLVEIGGEYLGRGLKSDGTPWWVELGIPMEPKPVTALFDLAVATSGTTERCYQIAGKRVPHIATKINDLRSVSVFAETCAEADSWATALLAAGMSAATELFTQHHLAAILVGCDGAASYSPALELMLR